MKKILIDLPLRQVERLDAMAKARRVTRVELIRRAVKDFIDQDKPADYLAMCGAWKSNPMTDDELLLLRAEWGS